MKTKLTRPMGKDDTKNHATRDGSRVRVYAVSDKRTMEDQIFPTVSAAKRYFANL